MARGDININTSPGARRILAYLEAHGPGEVKAIFDGAHVSLSYATHLLPALKAAGKIHIHAWRICSMGGHPAKLWAAGPGEDAQQPPKVEVADAKRRSYHKRRRELIAQYGLEVARKMLRGRNHGGADRIVLDGRQVYTRRPACS